MTFLLFILHLEQHVLIYVFKYNIFIKILKVIVAESSKPKKLKK